MANIKQAVKLGVFTLAIMNVTAVVSLRGLLFLPEINKWHELNKHIN